jgi:hypothetical protein
MGGFLPLSNLPYSIYLVLCMTSEGREVRALLCQGIKFQGRLKECVVKKVWLVSFQIFTAVFVQMKVVFRVSTLHGCLI